MFCSEHSEHKVQHLALLADRPKQILQIKRIQVQGPGILIGSSESAESRGSWKMP